MDRAILFSDNNIDDLRITSDNIGFLLQYNDEIIARDKILNTVLMHVERSENESFKILSAYCYQDISFDKFIGSVKSNQTKLEFQIFIVWPDTDKELVKTRASKFRISLGNLNSLCPDKLLIA
ncbi:MAG: hypothetical protein NTY74_14660 [Ignavibacteriae bacterium]|nr:hypothetical protein [Ignavibacteriota bacterium]